MPTTQDSGGGQVNTLTSTGISFACSLQPLIGTKIYVNGQAVEGSFWRLYCVADPGITKGDVLLIDSIYYEVVDFHYRRSALGNYYTARLQKLR